MKLTFDIDPTSLADLLCLVAQHIEDNNPTVEAKCFYSEICALTTDDTVRVNAARVQSILEHHANPLESKEFTDTLLAIGDALQADQVPPKSIEYIFVVYIGMEVAEFLAEYGKVTTPEPLFLKAIIDLTTDQAALTAAANIQWLLDTTNDPYSDPLFFDGLAVIVTACGFSGLEALNDVFNEHLGSWDVYQFIRNRPDLFKEV